MIKKIIELAKEYDMLPAGETVLCALSGGRDSMCLLWVLKGLSEEMGFQLMAAHFDHGLRGDDSTSDAAFVKSFCDENGIELHSGSGDVRAFAGKNRLGTEEAARTLRYDFLERTAEQTGAARIATAHNADDNVETVLMNLTRGAGIRGMAGIPPRRANIVRPILTVSREEIDAYVAENRLPFVEDKTNTDPMYTRNRLRHQVMPILKDINPRLCEGVAASSRLLRADAACLDAMAFSFLNKNSGQIFWEGLRRLPLALQSRVVRQAAKNAGANLSSLQTQAVLELAPQSGIDLKNGVSARREYERLVIEKASETAPTFRARELEAGKTIEIPEIDLEISCELSEKSVEINSSLTTFYFKNDKICGNIIVRPRKTGDMLRVGDGKGRTLKRLFIDSKVPKSKRELVPVLADDAGVIGVFGFGQDMRCAPDGDGTLIRVEIKRRNGQYEK